MSHRQTILGTAMAAALCILIQGAPAYAIVIGTADGANAFPFNNTGFSYPGTRYQQVYDPSSFAGPILISSISFYATLSDPAFRDADYMISLSTSNNPVNGLDVAMFDDNVGADAALFANLHLSGPVPDQFDILAGSGGGGAFLYDPSNGPLLVDIVISNIGASGFGGMDQMGDSSGLFSRAHDFGTGFDDWGLVTGFNEAIVDRVPEPATLTLLIVALSAVGLVRRAT